MRTLVSSFGIVASLQLAIAQTPPATPAPAQPPPSTLRPGTPTPAPSPDVPRTPGNPVPAPNPDAPRNRDTGILPPGPGVNPTSPPAAILTNAVPAIQNRGLTNRTGFLATDGRRINYSITNSLASMSQVQAQNVVQVQNALVNLQNAIANAGGVQDLQQAIQQNPQVQQQLQQISAQITALAQGPTKPSGELVQRLSADLLQAFSRARISPDAQMVLAVIINQTFNSGRLSSVQVNDLLDTVLVTLQDSGVPPSVAHPIKCDLHSIAYELQPNLGS
jgi:hypothetical protein